jgi:hypothetical protein
MRVVHASLTANTLALYNMNLLLRAPDGRAPPDVDSGNLVRKV